MSQPFFLDTHCHLDQFPNPPAILRTLAPARIALIAVTSLPSDYTFALERMIGHRLARIALGVHPLLVERMSPAQWRLFDQHTRSAQYIGEIGLDFSPEGIRTRQLQEKAFRRVLQAVGTGKVITLHSRRAESTVLEVLSECYVGPVIFHWYSGPLATLDRLLAAGHYCSFNPAMVHSPSGRKIIGRVPPERVLVETDGPYVQIDNRAAQPTDVVLVYEHLALLWQQPLASVVDQIFRNFKMFSAGETAENLGMYEEPINR